MKKSKRVLLVTGSNDVNKELFDPMAEDNSSYEEVCEMTFPSKQRYAKKHGYDLIHIRNFGEDLNGVIKDNETWHFRVYRSFMILNEYDLVMWLDADSIITNYDISIENFGVDEDFTFFASYAWPWKKSFSTGNFILKKTNKAKELFQSFYQILRNFEHEQATLNYIHQKNYNNLGNIFKILEHKYFDSIPTIQMYNSVGVDWGNRPEINYPWNKDSFMVHLTGIQNKNRVDIAKKYFSEYL